MWTVIGIALAFFALNLALPLVVLCLSRKQGASASSSPPPELKHVSKQLKAQDVLGWEFEYARTTASEAMDQRHTMVNFYLLVAGFVIAGVAAVWSTDSNMPPYVGTVLLWLLCGIGWIYTLSIVRLRQAWHHSARAMNRIKAFAVQRTEIEPSELDEAFLWKEHTLPPPDKKWNVFFYSVMLIALLDSLSFVLGALLLSWPLTLCVLARRLLLFGPLGLVLFWFHTWLYKLFLREKS